MTQIRRLTASGTDAFRSWLRTAQKDEIPPASLLTGEAETEHCPVGSVDESRKFGS
jgi:hypothetical protein